jgi:hypothetical protein
VCAMKLTVASLSLVVLGSTAFAQPKAAPPADKAPAAPMPVQAKPPGPPAPSQEIVDLGKAMNGTWKCTGQIDIAGTKADVKATITHKVDATLGKFWIVSNFNGTIVTPKGMPAMKFTMYTGYDANTKKLFRQSANSMGGHVTSSATYDAKKITFEGESSGMNGIVKVRNTEEMISPKEVKVSGEMSKDNGKTWTWDHEAICKK